MQFSIMCEDLKKIISTVKPVINSHSSIFSLASYLFEISENQATITGSDLEIVVQKSVGIPANGKIKFLVAAGLFSELITQLNSKQHISFKITENQKLEIISKEGKYILSILDAKEYPEFPNFCLEDRIKIQGQQLKQALAFVDYAVGQEEIRPAMTGIFIEQDENGRLVLVATDGHKLAKFVTDYSIDKQIAFIIPKKASDILLNILPDEEVIINYNTAYMQIVNGSTSFFTRLLKAKFPDYKKILPNDNDITIVMNRKELLETVRSLKKLATSNKIIFSFSKEAVILSVISEDCDKQEVTLTYKGLAEMEICFNPAYLIEMLTSISEEEITIKMNSPTKAVIVNSNEHTFNLVMPVRMQ